MKTILLIYFGMWLQSMLMLLEAWKGRGIDVLKWLIAAPAAMVLPGHRPGFEEPNDFKGIRNPVLKHRKDDSMNGNNNLPSSHRYRYVLRYITWVWHDVQKRNLPVERAWSVPFLWLAVLIMWFRREAWFKGGSVVDSLTGSTLYHIHLAGNIFGDGRAHLVQGPSPDRGA